MKKVLLSLAVFLVVSLATYAAVRAVLSDPDGHTVKLRSVPPGAIVTVDGVPLATTPCEAEDLATGPHEFSFVASGYRKRVVNTSVTEDTELSVKLEQYASSLLTVRTQPSAARVFIDGIEAGTSPLGRKLAPGKHTVSAVMKNYEEAIETVELAEGENSELTLQLQPSVVTYYTQLIESEPHNLYHHCDLMRYYYVKGEYEKLCTVIEMALEQIASPPSSNTAEGNVHWKSRSRFVQELGKTKGDDMKLYEEALRPHYLALVQESPHKDIAIQYIVFNYYAGRLNQICHSPVL
ncbi:MAG: PEGA domain-containing protein [Planctomycetota bacterium]|nr:PEGA domain-containing protein [Planctomycetota bacterium]